jgi:hypothetical protein
MPVTTRCQLHQGRSATLQDASTSKDTSYYTAETPSHLMLLVASATVVACGVTVVACIQTVAGILAIAGALLVPYTTHALFMQSKLFLLYFEY